jgi:GNAT superfamily N-acetyltransferase
VFNVQVQIMENVFYAINLGEYHAHQINRGWINLFRRWTAKKTFRRIWPGLRPTFSKQFVDFAEYHLNLGAKIDVDHVTPISGLTTCEPKLTEELQQEWPPGTRRKYEDFYKRFTDHTPLVLLRVRMEDIRLDGVTPLTNSETLGVAAAIKGHDDHLKADAIFVMVWVRGAYRRARIGSRLLSESLQLMKTDPLLKNSIAGRRIVVQLPLSSPEKPGYREEIAGWLRFYEQAGFVRSRDPDNINRLYLYLENLDLVVPFAQE